MKSLATLLLNEIELLENMTPQKNGNAPKNGHLSLADEVKDFEIGFIRNVLSQTAGHQYKASKILGIKPTTLSAKLRRYGIDAKEFSVLRLETFD